MTAFNMPMVLKPDSGSSMEDTLKKCTVSVSMDVNCRNKYVR